MDHRSQGRRPGPGNQQRPSDSGRAEDRKRPTEQQVSDILEHKPDRIDELAGELANQISRLTHSQVRNFYAPFVRLRGELAAGQDRSKEHARLLLMHKARTAYMAARDRKAEPLSGWFGTLFTKAARDGHARPQEVRALCDFAEAVVAYHYSKEPKGEEQ